jgi:hypothetical protein
LKIRCFSMSNRVSPRRPRRVQVQFWKRDEPHPFPGYTTNISMTGMFIATRSPYPPGTRLRIEVLEGDRGFVIEGAVVHARKVRGEMMRLTTPGMGIRFLTVEELVRELIPVGHGIEDLPGAQPDQAPVPPTPPIPAARPSPSAAWPSPSEAWPSPARAWESPSQAPSIPPPRGIGGAGGAGGAGSTGSTGSTGGTFAVHFLSPAEFVEVFLRDISNGGLFVSTRYPGRLQETVNVELHPPFPGAVPVLVRARVVQRFEPSTEGAPNLLAGMGVELLDLSAVVEQLKPYVGR